MGAKLVSINAGRARGFVNKGKADESAIWKEPVSGPVRVHERGLEPDEQVSNAHGGYDQALYAYSREDYRWWEEQLGTDLTPGTFGENLTTEGIDLSQVVAGERWQIGDIVMEATQPRIPCSTFQFRMQMDDWIERFNYGGRPGVYFRVLQNGTIQVGDSIAVKSVPDSSIRIYEMFRIRVFETHRSPELLSAHGLSEKWRSWALKTAATASK